MHNSDSDSMSEEIPTRELIEDESPEKKVVISFDSSIKIIEAKIIGSKTIERTVFKYSNYQIISIFDQKGEKRNHKVERRYSEFRWLYEHLASIPGLFLPPFPPKDFFNSLDENLIETRKRMLQRFLIHLYQKEPIYSNKKLIPFLTLSSENFASYKKDNPVVTKFLPSKPSGFMLYFSTSIPKIDLTPLRDKLDEIKVAENLPLIEIEKLNENAKIAGFCSKSFLKFSELVSEASKKMIINCDELREANIQTKTEEDINFSDLNINDNNKKDNVNEGEETDNGKGRNLNKSLKLISGVNELTSDYLNSTGHINKELSIGIENYGSEFAEVERLINQNVEISSDLNKADVLISEIKGKIIQENNSNKKRSYESLISSIKEFKILKEKAKKVFVMNFVKGFEKFRETRIDKLERIVSGYVDNQIQIVEKAIDHFDRIEKF